VVASVVVASVVVASVVVASVVVASVVVPPASISAKPWRLCLSCCGLIWILAGNFPFRISAARSLYKRIYWSGF
jgi:hypothetical protein